MQTVRKTIVTGAAGGIGRAVATSLVAAGHFVILCDRDEAVLQALSAELGERTAPLALDITGAGAVAGAPAAAAAFGRIDTLINNAGHHVGGGTNFAEGMIEDWASIIETNLIGLARVTHAFLPGMIEHNRGHIVNISSIGALRIMAAMGPYSASKAGVHMLSDVLRAELADTELRVTEINPGLTKTNIQLARFKGDAAKAQQYFDRFRMSLAPEDVARSVMFALDQPAHVQIAQMVVLPTDRF
jgi:3-hydroxy acid dehydrogenase/malonic semialdehyde reductase